MSIKFLVLGGGGILVFFGGGVPILFSWARGFFLTFLRVKYHFRFEVSAGKDLGRFGGMTFGLALQSPGHLRSRKTLKTVTSPERRKLTTQWAPARHLDVPGQKLPRDNFCLSIASQLPSPQGVILKEEKNALSCGGRDSLGGVLGDNLG